jgi:uncharacterized OB-fold protein
LPDPVLRQPALVMVTADGSSDEKRVPRIRARRCACGHVFHPPHPYGCEKCGRDGGATEATEIDARGVLTAVATVHVHPKLPTPFVLGRVTLDAGPVVEAWLGGTPAEATLGARVRATLVESRGADSGAPLLDIRFVSEEGGR